MDERKFTVGTKRCGVLCGAVGALIALCLILFGFWNTVLIAAMFGAGYFLGVCPNKGELLKKLVDRFVPKKGE